MIIYDLFLTIVESLILSAFIFANVDLIKQKISGLILAFIFVIETFVFNNIYVNNLLLLVFELVTGLIFIYYYKKNIRFLYVFIICLSIGLIITSNLISLSVCSLLLHVDINSMNTNLLFYFLATFLSKIVYFIWSIVCYRFLKRTESSLTFLKWWPLLMFFASVLIMVIVITESIVFNTISLLTLWVLLICLIISLLLAIYIYIKINVDNKKQIELTRQIVKNQYINKNYQKMNYLYNKTIKERHEMTYILLQIKNEILQNRCENALNVLNNQISKTENMQLLRSTQNPYFDYKIHEVLDVYRERGYKIKTSFSLCEIEILSDEDFVEEMLGIIDYLVSFIDDSKYMSIFLNQKNQNLILTIDVSSSCQIEDIFICTKHKNITRVLLSKDCNLLTIRILIELS